MADETQQDYVKKLGKWGLFVLAAAAVMALNALMNKYIGSGTPLPPPPAPVIVVSPDMPVDVKVITPRVNVP